MSKDKKKPASVRYFSGRKYFAGNKPSDFPEAKKQDNPDKKQDNPKGEFNLK